MLPFTKPAGLKTEHRQTQQAHVWDGVDLIKIIHQVSETRLPLGTSSPSPKRSRIQRQRSSLSGV